MFGLFKNQPPSKQLAEKIRWVAGSIHQPEIFAARARQAASQLGPASIPELARHFHGEHSPPPELAAQFPGLGQWIAARQRAIFEIFYHFRESALPVLRHVAHGQYDWTQGNAIEILCRLAAEGLETEAIITELRAAIPKMRFEALLGGFGPLLHPASLDANLAQLLKRFTDLPAFNEAIDDLCGPEETPEQPAHPIAAPTSPPTDSPVHHCPNCNRSLYNRRLSHCGFCGVKIPEELRFNSQEIAALDLETVARDQQRKERQKAEDIRVEAAEEKRRKQEIINLLRGGF